MWGENRNYIMGFQNYEIFNNETINHLINPIRLPLDKKVSEISIGPYHGIGKIKLQDHDEFIAWGYNKDCECG